MYLEINIEKVAIKVLNEYSKRQTTLSNTLLKNRARIFKTAKAHPALQRLHLNDNEFHCLPTIVLSD